MAKVTITLEDTVGEDGSARMRVTAESDNKDSEEYTIAEIYAEQFVTAIIQQNTPVASGETPPNDKETLN